MDGFLHDDPGYNYHGGAEGGLYYAQEFRVSKVGLLDHVQSVWNDFPVVVMVP